MKRFANVMILCSAFAAAAAFGADSVIVGGQSMHPTKDIVDNAVNSSDHTALVAVSRPA